MVYRNKYAKFCHVRAGDFTASVATKKARAEARACQNLISNQRSLRRMAMRAQAPNPNSPIVAGSGMTSKS